MAQHGSNLDGSNNSLGSSLHSGHSSSQYPTQSASANNSALLNSSQTYSNNWASHREHAHLSYQPLSGYQSDQQVTGWYNNHQHSQSDQSVDYSNQSAQTGAGGRPAAHLDRYSSFNQSQHSHSSQFYSSSNTPSESPPAQHSYALPLNSFPPLSNSHLRPGGQYPAMSYQPYPSAPTHATNSHLDNSFPHRPDLAPLSDQHHISAQRGPGQPGAPVPDLDEAASSGQGSIGQGSSGSNDTTEVKRERKKRRLKGEIPKDHESLGKYQCEDCQARFARPSALATHIVIVVLLLAFISSTAALT